MVDDLIAAVADKYGFRAADYSCEWDGGTFDPGIRFHRLVITAKGGRRVTAQLSGLALSNPWASLGHIEDAFAKLQLQEDLRGE